MVSKYVKKEFALKVLNKTCHGLKKNHLGPVKTRVITLCVNG